MTNALSSASEPQRLPFAKDIGVGVVMMCLGRERPPSSAYELITPL